MSARIITCIWKDIRLSDVLLAIYLCTQFCYPFGSALDTNLCRASFLLYVLGALICDVVPLVKSDDRRFLNPFFLWTLVFWSFAFISLLWSPDINSGFDVTYLNNAIHIMILSILMPARFRSKDDFYLLLHLFVFVILYVAVMLVIMTPTSAWGTERIGDAIGLNRNTASILLVFASFISFYLARKRNKKLYYFFCIPLIALSLMTGSRKGFLLIPISFLAFLISSERGFKGLIKFLVGVVLFVWLFNLVMTIPDLYNVMGTRLEITLDGLIGNGVDTLDVMREFYREFAIQLFWRKPFVGYGMNGFEIMLHSAINSEYAYSHCNYTELLSCFGLAGFVLYYIEFAFLLRKSLGLFESDRVTASLLTVLLLSILVLDYGNVSFPGIDNALLLLII